MRGGWEVLEISDWLRRMRRLKWIFGRHKTMEKGAL